jgi:hypothetical protein
MLELPGERGAKILHQSCNNYQIAKVDYFS